MSKSTQTRVPPEVYPYVPFEAWTNKLEQGPWPVYVTVHVWNNTSIIAETFIAPDDTSVVIDELATFLARHNGHWSQSVNQRQARWIEVVCRYSWDSTSIPFTNSLFKCLGLSAGMNEETTHPSFAIPQGTSPGISARLADYEHVTHIRLEDSWKVADMFVTNDNDVITLAVKVGSEWFGTASKLLRGTSTLTDPEDTESLKEYNAAMVVQQCLSAVAVHHRDDAHRKTDSRRSALDAWDGKRLFEFENETRERNAFASQVLDICENLLKQQGGLEGEIRKWVTQGIRMRLSTASSWLSKAVRSNDESIRQLAHKRDQRTLEAIREGNRIAAKQAEVATEQAGITATQARTFAEQARIFADQARIASAQTHSALVEGNRTASDQAGIARNHTRIAADQAHSAVILNLLLALLTAVTILCLPFVMTAAYFGMNTFDKAGSLTVKKFWIASGSATGGFIGIGIALAAIAIVQVKTIHNYVTNLLGTGEKNAANPNTYKSDTEGQDTKRIPAMRSLMAKLIAKLGRSNPMADDVERTSFSDPSHFTDSASTDSPRGSSGTEMNVEGVGVSRADGTEGG